MVYTLISFCYRNPDLTVEEFRDRYTNKSVPMVYKLAPPPLAPTVYTQTYPDVALMKGDGHWVDCATRFEFRDEQQ